jgi:alkylation response protein AidB-like acyl-CoA dehydrogenase
MSTDLLFTAEELAFKNKIAKYMREKVAPRAVDIDTKFDYPEDIMRELLKLGMGGVCLPKEKGGLGLSYTAEVLAHEEIGRVSPSIAIMTDTHLFTMHIIAYCGNPYFDERYVVPGAKGEKLYSVAITEPAGSANIPGWTSRFEIRGDDVILNADKVQATNAPGADAFVTSIPGPDGLYVFMVDKDNPGVSIVRPMPNCGMRGCGASEVAFRDCVVPKVAMSKYPTREESGYGGKIGFMYMPAAALGIMEACLELNTKRLSERDRFGTPLASRGIIAKTLAEMAADIEMARGLLYNTTKLADAGDLAAASQMTDMCKSAICDMANHHVYRSIELHGNYGYQDISGLPALMHGALAAQIGDAPTQYHWLMVAQQMGLPIVDY